MQTHDELIKKARKKLDESIRGRDYQDRLLKGPLTDKELAVIQKRRDIFQDRVCLLMDLFGPVTLSSDTETCHAGS